jgi:hypothetical protein
MTREFIQAMQLWEAAKPASGFCPATEEEWKKLHIAFEEMGYVIFRKSGMSTKNARALARKTYGGPVGLAVLKISLSEENHG